MKRKFTAALVAAALAIVPATAAPAGTLDLAIAPVGEGVEAAVLEASPDLATGGSYSVVAHLTEGGDPALLLETNVTDEGAGIQVLHTAAFGAVDILPTDATGLEGVANGQTAFVATGPGDVEGVGVAPAEVPAGSGGLADSGRPMWVAALMALDAVGLAAPATATARRRSRPRPPGPSGRWAPARLPRSMVPPGRVRLDGGGGSPPERAASGRGRAFCSSFPLRDRARHLGP